MRSIFSNLILLAVFFIADSSVSLAQEKQDTEGPITGGFQHDPSPRLLISRDDGIYIKVFGMNPQRHESAVINVYSFYGNQSSIYTIYTDDDYSFTISAPTGIYFIKVDEEILVLFLRTGDKIHVLFW